jgi:hypothetical protein
MMRKIYFFDEGGQARADCKQKFIINDKFMQQSNAREPEKNALLKVFSSIFKTSEHLICEILEQVNYVKPNA